MNWDEHRAPITPEILIMWADWSAASEWRRQEAMDCTKDERKNLRSWGLDVLEPPPTMISSPLYYNVCTTG